MSQYWGSTKHFFILILYNFNCPPPPYSAVPELSKNHSAAANFLSAQPYPSSVRVLYTFYSCLKVRRSDWENIETSLLFRPDIKVHLRDKILPKTPIKSHKSAQSPLGKLTLFLWQYFGAFWGSEVINRVEFLRHFHRSLKTNQ